MEYVTNIWALLAAVAASVIIGMVWYGPLFGKAWMASIGKTPEDFKDKGMAKGMVTFIVGAFVMAWIMSRVLQAFHPDWTAVDGLSTGFFMWLGFVVPVIAGTTVSEGRKMDYFWVAASYRLVEMLAIGLALGLWL